MLTAEAQRGFVPVGIEPTFKEGIAFYPVIAKKNINKGVVIGNPYYMFVLPENHKKFNPKKLKVDIHDQDFKLIMGINFYDFEEFETFFKFSHE